jgi:hypothetical protein
MNPTEITIDQAIATLENVVNKYTIDSIKKQIYQKDHEKQKEAFEDKYGWSYWSTLNEQPQLSYSKSFEGRTEALAWIKEEKLGPPTFEKIAFACSEGTPRTLCSLKCSGVLDGVLFEIVANYYRDGLPTKKCRVVPSVSYSVVCNTGK